MAALAERIQEQARRLLAEKRIDLFIGFAPGILPLTCRPVFIREPEEAENLTWGPLCLNNLAVYLPKLYEPDAASRRKGERPRPRLGLALKPCDLRSTVALIKENQVRREDLFLIGVPCLGMIDPARARERIGGEATGLREEGEKIVFLLRQGGEKALSREELLLDCCRECRLPSPEGADLILEGPCRPAGDGGREAVAEMAARSRPERWEAFKREVSRCIRCNACRQACPTCYCRECFAEQTDPRWIGASTELTDTMVFHIIRIFHQAGRCVSCDACYRACPQGIDLRPFSRALARDVEEQFGFLPGFDIEPAPPLTVFREDDPQAFITEPES